MGILSRRNSSCNFVFLLNTLNSSRMIYLENSSILLMTITDGVCVFQYNLAIIHTKWTWHKFTSFVCVTSYIFFITYGHPLCLTVYSFLITWLKLCWISPLLVWWHMATNPSCWYYNKQLELSLCIKDSNLFICYCIWGSIYQEISLHTPLLHIYIFQFFFTLI